MVGVSLVGFDLDGTLHPEYPAVNKKMNDLLCRAGSRDTGRSLQMFTQGYERALGKTDSQMGALRYMGVEKPEEMVYGLLPQVTDELLSSVQSDPELVSMMEGLKGQYDLFLVTGKPGSITREILERIGLDPGIFLPRECAVSDAKRMDYQNPNHPIRRATQFSRVSLERTVFVGDRPLVDIEPAKNMGAKTVLVGGEGEESMDHRIIGTIYELPSVLESL